MYYQQILQICAQHVWAYGFTNLETAPGRVVIGRLCHMVRGSRQRGLLSLEGEC